MFFRHIPFLLKVRDVNSFWNWIDSSFLPSVYGKVWHGDGMADNKVFIADFVTLLVGSPMIRQLRVIPGKLLIPLKY